MAVGVSVAAAILSMIMAIIIICVLKRLVHTHVWCIMHMLWCCFIILTTNEMWVVAGLEGEWGG